MAPIAPPLRPVGIDHQRLTYKFQGLDFKLTGVEKCRVVDEILASGDLAELHGRQDPEAETAAIIAAACLATEQAGRLPDDAFSHGDESAWWNDGVRVLHGRFPR